MFITIVKVCDEDPISVKSIIDFDLLDFLEKNRDTFSQDLMKLLQDTKSKFLRNLFLNEFQIGTETRKRAPSLGTQFRKSLDSLMSILSACQPFFIRCIKPNEYKTPNVSSVFFP